MHDDEPKMAIIEMKLKQQRIAFESADKQDANRARQQVFCLFLQIAVCDCRRVDVDALRAIRHYRRITYLTVIKQN
jgi:hypothetical protein